MDGIVVLPFIQVLLGRLKSGKGYDMKYMSEKLVGDLEEVVSSIGPVGVNQTDYATKKSLRDLQDLIFGINDLVDKLQIKYSVFSDITNVFLHVFVRSFVELALIGLSHNATHSFQAKFLTVVRPLDEIKRKLPVSVPSINNKSKSGAIILDLFKPLPHVWREREKNEIIHAVLGGGEFRVISIVGPMGIGKKTLARCIFTDERVEKHFERRVWVGASRDGKCVGFCNDRSKDFVYFDQSEIQKELSIMLQKSKVLIVLDDCWDEAIWRDLLKEMLNLNSKESVILVTTRSRSLASAHGTQRASVNQLEWLSAEASSAILDPEKVYGSYSSQIDPASEDPLNEIVKLCKGVPLILKKVEDLLHSKGPSEAGRVLARLKEGKLDEIIENFSLCYEVLPSHLKLPFQTLFLQKACGLSVEALTCLWMALGFVYRPDTYQQSAALTQLLDIGREYLREFAESDLSPKVEYAPGRVIRDIHMDDHMYRLSLRIARGGNWVMIRDKSSQKIDKSARYIIWIEDAILDNAMTEDLISAEKAQLFIIHTKEQTPANVVRGIISRFKSLRVLGLGGCDIEKLPSSIGGLIHLRYLDLGRNPTLKKLPYTIYRLYHLQTLNLRGCEALKEIPQAIGKLKNLMYLTLTTLQISLPPEIGKLVHLQTLGLFECKRLASLPQSIEKFKHLRTLAIVGCPEMDLAADSSVKGLRRNKSIETLLLKDLPKFTGFPSELESFFATLKHLVIQSCESFTDTTWIKMLKPLLSLTMEGCPELSVIMDGTTQLDSLLELVIRNCENLDNTAWIKQFKSLRSLIINDCPKLQDLDAGFTELKKLERLEIRGCPDLIEPIQNLRRTNPSDISHVRVVELDGESLPIPSESKSSDQEGNSKRRLIMDVASSSTHVATNMDVASSSTHVVPNSISVSEISEEAF